MENYKAVISYDGTDFNGFQLQTHQPGMTIQDRLERALCKVTNQSRQELRLQAAGRTDAGVHARGQVISFLLPPQRMAALQLQKAVNASLPAAIRVLHVSRVPLDFSARHTAVGKQYDYTVHLGEVDPFVRHFCHRVTYPLDMALVREAAAIFVGRHDFTQFANLPPVNEFRDPVKTLHRFDIIDTSSGFRAEVEGTGFLYKMIRHLIGAVLTAGRGKLPLSAIDAALDLGSTRLPGNEYRGWNIANAKGLCLMRVDYPRHDDLQSLMHPERVNRHL